MFQQEHQRLVLEKITAVLAATAETHAERLASRLDCARRVFVAGAGRSKLVGNFLAMRLMHAGYRVSVVGEIVTPRIRQGDLLVVISGSGQTEQLIAFAKRAQAAAAEVVLITASRESALGDLSNESFMLGQPASYEAVPGLPMGTVFELSALCFLEALISLLIWKKQLSEVEMRQRHANLE